MKKLLTTTVAFIAAVMLLSGVSSAQTVENASVTPNIDYSPLAVAIERSGLPYQKTAPGIWIIPVSLSDDDQNNINIIIQANQAVVSCVVLVSKVEDPVSQELKNALVDLNNKYLLVKFAYDKDAVFIKTDTLLGEVTGNTVSAHINILKQIAMTESSEIIKYLPKKEQPKK